MESFHPLSGAADGAGATALFPALRFFEAVSTAAFVAAGAFEGRAGAVAFAFATGFFPAALATFTGGRTFAGRAGAGLAFFAAWGLVVPLAAVFRAAIAWEFFFAFAGRAGAFAGVFARFILREVAIC